MSAVSTVYAVSSGSYSDYEVERIFELREDAEAFIEEMGGGSQWRPFDIEEFDFHPAGQRPEVYIEYAARCWPDRKKEIEQTSIRTTDKPKHTPMEDITTNRVYFACTGPDRERCLKSVSDRVAQWKAFTAGIS